MHLIRDSLGVFLATGAALTAAGIEPGTPEDLGERLRADAATRSSLLRAQTKAEPPIKIGGLIQSRFNANLRQQDAAQSVDDFESGFLMRRVRLKLSGDLDIADGDGEVPWVVQTETNRSNGNVFVLDAWVGYETGNWRFRVGQYQPPLQREPLVSNTRRMTVEVSPVTGAFSTSGAGGRTQGAEARYRSGDWQVTVMVGDGDRGGNADFTADEGDIGLYTRVERKVGEESWRRFRDFTSKRDSSNAWLLGAAGLVTVGETDANNDGLQREAFYELIGTTDVSFEGNGWSAFAAANISHRSAQAVDDVNMFGVSGHVAAYVTDSVELFTQYSWMTGEDAAGELSVLVAGFNTYLSEGHTLKFTGDVGYSFNEITAAYASDLRALLRDAPGEDGQVFLRGQLQLAF